MRRIVMSSLLVMVVCASALASQTRRSTLGVEIAPGGGVPGTGVAAERTEFYLGNPSAGVPASRLAPGTAPAADSFNIRAWAEGDNARVVVYAKLRDSRVPAGFIETPISTFTLAAGRSVEVTETDLWGAAHVFVSAKAR